jgi:hypothetical protein
MSGADSEDGRADELTERYRAASARDPARPSDKVRQSIFAYARTVSADHASRGMATAPTRRPAANDSSWRISAAASIIVAGFATVLAWHVHAPTPGPTHEPNPPPASIGAHNEPATGSTVSNEPSEPRTPDRRTTTTLAPNAVTARSRQRTVVPAEVAGHGAAADLDGGGAVASSPQVPMRVAGSSAAENATAQVAPSAAAAPPNVEARQRPALGAAASPATNTTPNSLLVRAAESGNLERVDQLLRGGLSAEQTDARGRTALLIATLRGDLPMVRRLLAAGARADVVDEDGDTPLAAARRQGQPELERLLEGATR